MSKTQVEPRATGEWSHYKALNILGRNYSKATRKTVGPTKYWSSLFDLPDQHVRLWIEFLRTWV